MNDARVQPVDIAVVGAGAAGLMASIWAGRAADAGARIVALDGARTLGAKILVAGGGRCNVTHDHVDERAYAGSSPNAIRKVLRQFDVPRTIGFFRELGVELKREETGKLFPTTDSARTVLDALLRATREAGVEVWHPWRVERITRRKEGFEIARQGREAHDAEAHGAGFPRTETNRNNLHSEEHHKTGLRDTGPHGAGPDETGLVLARRVVLATGGLSLPKTGSDGGGYRMARALGHTVTGTYPALVPLTLPREHPLCALSGIAAPATVELRSATGKRLVAFEGPVLCAHFGLSGPAILDISRYWLARGGGSSDAAALAINWLPSRTPTALDADLAGLKNTTPLRFLAERLPERLARVLCEMAGVEVGLPGHQLTRERRRALADAATQMPLTVTGSRGYLFAEVTAGGVPLSEVHLESMESRVCPRLHLCGEICDVDGRIGGYNFQWAWASGYVAGSTARRMLASNA
ncbi:MAG: NAD(P)/FAD-dependent oxidoreductase [Phycisphaerales bacterium]